MMDYNLTWCKRQRSSEDDFFWLWWSSGFSRGLGSAGRRLVSSSSSENYLTATGRIYTIRHSFPPQDEVKWLWWSSEPSSTSASVHVHRLLLNACRLINVFAELLTPSSFIWWRSECEKYSCFLQKSVQTVSVSPHISLIYRPNNTRWDVRWCSCLPEPPASLNLLISCLLPLVWPPHLPLVFTRCTCTDRTVDQVCRVLVIKICIPLCEPCKHTRSVSRTSSCNWTRVTESRDKDEQLEL